MDIVKNQFFIQNRFLDAGIQEYLYQGLERTQKFRTINISRQHRILHKRCSEKLSDNILKMGFTVTGGVRPKNRLFEINQTVVLIIYPKHIKKPHVR